MVWPCGRTFRHRHSRAGLDGGIASAVGVAGSLTADGQLCRGCLQQPLATRHTNWSRSHEQPAGRRHRKAGRRVQGHHRAAVGYNLLFWLLVVAIAALLVLIATSFEGMHLDITGGPGRIL